MRLPGKRIWFILVLLVGAGLVAYMAGWYFWEKHHLRAAENALLRRDFPQAMVHLKKCVEAFPKDVSYRLYLAQTARRSGAFDEAAAQLRLCRGNNELKAPLALEHRLLRMQHYGDLSEADTLLSYCVDYPQAPETPIVLEAYLHASVKALKPALAGRPDAHLEKGAPKPYLARLFQAAELWLQLRPEAPDQAQGLVWRGLAHVFANERSKGLNDLQKALELDAENEEARVQGALLLAQEKPAATIAELANLQVRFPHRNDVAVALATAQRTLGKFEEARKLLDAVINSDPNEFSALLESGALALAKGQPADAERPLRQALALQPNAASVHRALSRCLHLTGREAEAKRHHDRSLELDPSGQK